MPRRCAVEPLNGSCESDYAKTARLLGGFRLMAGCSKFTLAGSDKSGKEHIP